MTSAEDVSANYSPIWILCCIAGSIVALSFYFRDLERASLAAGRGLPIGSVKQVVNDVQRRPNDRLLWLNLRDERPVYKLDTVRTGSDSSVVISLNEGQGTVVVSPNSLVVLDTEKQAVEVRLASGDLFVRGRVKTRVGERVVDSNDGEINIAKTADRGTIEIQVQKGTVHVDGSTGAAQTVDHGSLLLTDQKNPDQIIQLPLTIKSPENLSTQKIKEGDSVAFHFEGTLAPELGPMELQLSKDPEFNLKKLIILPVNQVDASPIAHLAPGTWFGRLYSPRIHQNLSPVNEFSVKIPPRLQWKDSNTGHFIGRIENNRVGFSVSWEPVQGAHHYTLILSHKAQKIWERNLEDNSFVFSTQEADFVSKLKNLPGWKEEPVLHIQLAALDSKSMALTEPLAGDLAFQDDRRAPSPVALKVEAIPGKPLEAQIHWDTPQANDVLNFELKVGKETLKTDQKLFKVAAKTLYENTEAQVQIRSLGSNGLSSDWTSANYDRNLFELAALVAKPVQILYPSQDSRILQSNEVSVEWLAPKPVHEKVDYYELQITSDNKKFKAINEKVKTDRFKLPRLLPGRYTIGLRPYWAGYGFGTESQKRSFSVLRGAGLGAPSLREPAGE